METVNWFPIMYLSCGLGTRFGKNTLYLWTYCPRPSTHGLSSLFHWVYTSPTNVDGLYTLFFWAFQATNSADNSKVEFRWCYNNLNSIFIMKTMLLQLVDGERNPFAYSWIQKNQTRHHDESGLKTK